MKTLVCSSGRFMLFFMSMAALIVFLNSSYKALSSMRLLMISENGGMTRELAVTGKYTEELPLCSTFG